MAAAPLVATAGGLLVPATARAAAAAELPGVRLWIRTGSKEGGGTSYPDAIKGLGDVEKLPHAPFGRVMGDLNRDGTYRRRPDWPRRNSPAVARAFTWRHDDFITRDWRPQGITTDYDGHGTGGNVVLVSWYTMKKAAHQAARISFVDVSGSSRPRYRHVLLVEPYREGGRYSFRPVTVHVGGIAWYKERLYVVDTYRGLRVFNLDQMFQVATGGQATDHCGLHTDNRYYGYGCKYVLPQSRGYDDIEPEIDRMRYSQVSVDRTTKPYDTLLVSEFVDKKAASPEARAVRFEVEPDYGALRHVDPATQSVLSQKTYRITNGKQIQGAASVNETFYVSRSDGPSVYGYLATGRASATDLTVRTSGRVVRGPEDLSYAQTGGRRLLWSLGEYAVDDQDRGTRPRSPYNSRYVYAIRL
ncbi:hypothetical protein OG735_23020 [Streptomyces sp. NBC_01210]|uniref:hypothetical protein n=1 Tax=Streptomyces sp. NBC_01210 TaxID=2903774 RepID=UPI002E0F4774|nr:hypothetical protein OG735_23020 [Streptomyces sp. NBC_01210]